MAWRNKQVNSIQKQLGLIVMICFLYGCLTSCGKNPKKQTGIPSEEQSSNGILSDISAPEGEGVIFKDGNTYTEEYVIYTPEGSSRPKYIFDIKTGQSIPYCFDTACEHKHEKRSADGNEILEEGCPAYDYTDASVYIFDDSLWFFSEQCLYQADVTGLNRKEVTRLSKPYFCNNTYSYYTDEALYLTYSLPFELIEKEGNGKTEWLAGGYREKPEVGVLRIPYSGEGEEVIYSSDEFYQMNAVELWYHDGCISFQILGSDRPPGKVDYSASQEDIMAQIEEEQKHTYVEAFDYVIATGEVKSYAYQKPYRGIYFFRGAYGLIQEGNQLELYRYSGEKIAITDEQFSGVYSDRYIIGYNMENNKGILRNQDDGKVVKTSPFTWEDFLLEVVVGESYYGWKDGQRAYISASDYWNGNMDGIILFQE